ncbi:FAD-binding oxidoreductase [Flavobacterium selenitireducens]|uniref:FAD-binding oxidoreductase n=1 Tax=Flavobacterium selenitireducens TaxID=2722704 RepID=UPI001CC28335|nr:FAD-binding oxidoreductase [Flavobacterium selenitireducens]
MRRKKIALTGIGILLLFLSFPIAFIVRTALSEDGHKLSVPSGYANDASELNLTKVDSVIDIAKSKDSLLLQIRSLVAYAKAKNKPISIAGAQHSMGGHTMFPDGIVLNMRPYDHIEFDSASNVLTIGSGARWEDAINYLDKFDKSIAVMQAFSTFSIGGSISVNGHGWQKDSPPVSSSVISFTLLKSDGEIVNCSRSENAELFRCVVGGYGLFGIILDVKLRVVDNENMSFTRYKLDAKDYLTYFKKYASGDRNAKLVFGRLNISDKEFLQNATLNVFRSTGKPLMRKPKHDAFKTTEVKRLVFRSSVDSEYGKRLRWDLETNLGEFTADANISRNEILNDDVSLIENKNLGSTDILQEYFIPERRFNRYVQQLKSVLPDSDIDLINITIRNVYQDEDSFMPYARENVFGFVFLFNQKKTRDQENAMRRLTQTLVRLAIENDGTYYLPYRLHVDRNTFRKIYPQADAFFALKDKYDPDGIFRNTFYAHYR